MPLVEHATSMLPCVFAMDMSKSKGLWAPWVALPSESRIAVRKQARLRSFVVVVTSETKG